MEVMYKEFIGIYQDVFTSEFCDEIISWYEKCKQNHASTSAPVFNEPGIIRREDQFIPMTEHPEHFNHSPVDLITQFNTTFWSQCYENYVSVFPSVIRSEPGRGPKTPGNYHIKVQKTLPTEGYHVWHHENGSSDCGDRVLTWILYLNDIVEGGETEFLYQSLRVSPRKGTLILWPAYFTHVHRGNPPLSQAKYIATGWITYI